MALTINQHPRVFISYSHDNLQHKKKVLALSNWLCKNGVNCHIDQYTESPKEGWPRWMKNQIGKADFVLVVCTKMYYDRFKGVAPPGEGKGADWEGAIITNELYQSKSKNMKFISVLFSSKDANNIPEILGASTFYNLERGDGYKKLYRRLTKQHSTPKPPLGVVKLLPTVEPPNVEILPHQSDLQRIPLLSMLPTTKNNLPQRPIFIDRPKQIKKVLDSINEWPITVIWGAPGCGKTALAIEIGYRVLESGRFNAVLWVSARAKSVSKHDVADAILGFYGFSAARRLPPEKRITTAYKLMPFSSSLLICDNAETIETEHISSFIDFISGIPSPCKVLITTRYRRLSLSNIIILDKAKIIRLSNMTKSQALALACREVERINSPKKVTKMDLGRLVKACDKNPLVIIWAVSQLLYVSINHVIRKLESGAEQLIETIFSSVWKQLSLPTRQVLTIVALCRKPIPSDTIQFVTGLKKPECKSGLVQAIDMALLDQDTILHDTSYYTVHPLTQSFVFNQTNTECKQTYRQRMAEYYVHFLKDEQSTLSKLARAYDRIEAELQNIIDAFEYCCQTKAHKLGAEILLRITRFLWNRGYWDKQITMTREALDSFRVPNNIRVHLCSNIAWVYSRRGNIEDALTWVNKAKDLLGKDATYEAGLIELTLGQIAYRQNDFSLAKQHLNAALKIYTDEETKNIRIAKADVWDYLGDLHRDSGLWYLEQDKSSEASAELKESLSWYEKVRNFAEQNHWSEKLATATGDIGHVSLYLNNYNKAGDYLQEGLRLATEIHRIHTMAYCKLGLGELCVAWNAEHHVSTTRYMQEAKSIYVILGIEPAVRQINKWLEALRDFANTKRFIQPHWIRY